MKPLLIERLVWSGRRCRDCGQDHTTLAAAFACAQRTATRGGRSRVSAWNYLCDYLGLEPAAWHDDAACRRLPGIDPSWFHTPAGASDEIDVDERREATIAAVAVCSLCTVRDECLAWALEHREHGIWGGTTDRERTRMRATPTRPVEVALSV